MKRKYLFITSTALGLILTSCGTIPGGEVGPTKIDVTSVTVSGEKTEIEVNEELQLTASVLPDDATDKTVTWKSNNTGFVSVTQNGIVRGVAAGSTTIEAVSKSNPTVKGTYSITVKASEVPEVYTLSTDELTVGSTVVFASQTKNGSGYAMGEQSTYNRKAVDATFVNGTLLQYKESTFKTFEVREGTVAGSFAFYDKDANGYLCAASSSSNYLKTENSITKASSFKVEGTEEKTITSLGSYSRKVIRANVGGSNKLFACYSTTSTTGSLPYIYEIAATPVYPTDITITKPTDNKMSVGDTFQIEVSYVGQGVNIKKASFSSSNTNYATVSNTGLITASAAGTTTITVKAKSSETDYITKTFDLTISTVAVSGISFDSAAADVKVGKTITLAPTIAPSNATNKSVTWKTSNSDVATVSDGVVTGVSIGTARITATTVDGNKSAYVDVTVSNLDEWTVLMYVCGANLESGGADDYGHYSSSDADYYGGQATADIKEILSVSGQPDDINIVIETGGAGAWASSLGISADYIERYHVKNKSIVRQAQLSKANMGASDTLKSFITWGVQTYPAKNYGLIMWNHGGAMGGCCADELYNNDSLTPRELVTAVGGAFTTLGMTEKMEFIGYDCCLMQVQDIAELNSQFFNYMVASEEVENGTGWDYDSWVDALYAKKSTTTILKAIVDGFITDNGGTSSTRNDQTLSYLDLSYMSSYKTAFESFTNKIKSTVGISKVRSIIKNVTHYADTQCSNSDYQEYTSDYGYPTGWFDGPYGSGRDKYYILLGYYLYGTFDVVDMLNQMKSDSSFSSYTTDIDNLLSILGNLIAYDSCGAAAGNSNGLCVVCAMDDDYFVGQDYTSNQTNFSNWRSFVTA